MNCDAFVGGAVKGGGCGPGGQPDVIGNVVFVLWDAVEDSDC